LPARDPHRFHGCRRPGCAAEKQERRAAHERELLNATGAAALPAVSRIAWAQTYPAQPVRIIVGLHAGTATDILARLVGQSLSERLGKQFIVENRPGAAGNIATEVVMRASPDGYTLLQVNSGNAVSVALREPKFQFHPRHHAGRVHRPHALRHGG
jgi:tripartite-type tricarboxylate transporter receptor subunit TctC